MCNTAFHANMACYDNSVFLLRFSLLLLLRRKQTTITAATGPALPFDSIRFQTNTRRVR